MQFNRSVLAAAFTVFTILSESRADDRDFELSSGIEYFSWREYISSCPQTLEERGPRFFVGLDKTNRDYAGWDLGLKGKAYVGLVYYDGFDISCSPLAATTSYLGVTAEADAIRWLNSESSETSFPQVGIKLGLGFDTWRRTILASGGYSEDYVVGFGRLGLAAARGNAWSAEAGVKYPFTTSEVAYLTGVGYSSNASLNPKGNYSYFANLRFQPPESQYTWLIYYDSYRFDASDSVPISACPSTPCSVYQPTSHQDTVGVSLTFNH